MSAWLGERASNSSARRALLRVNPTVVEKIASSNPAMAAAAVELCLEGLHLSRRLDRHESDAGYTYLQSS